MLKMNRTLRKIFTIFLMVTCCLIACNGYDRDYYDKFCRPRKLSCSYQIQSSVQEECEISRLTNSSFESCQESFVSNYSWIDLDSDKNDDVSQVIPSFIFSNFHPSVGSILNVSVNIDKNVQGILFWFTIDRSNYCRGMYIDRTTNRNPLSLYYDCLVFLRKETGSFFEFKVMALPSRKTKEFMAKVPVSNNDWSEDIEQLEVPIFIEKMCLGVINTICILFSEVPRNRGVFNYTVMLRSSGSVDERILHFSGGQSNTTNHNLMFKDLQQDVEYTPIITIDTPRCVQSKNCKENVGPLFLFASDEKILVQPSTIHMVLAGVISILFVFLLIWALICRRKKPDSDNEKTEVLVLYSHDNRCYMKLVEEFVTLLRCNGFTVYFDRESLVGNPFGWLKEHIFKEKIRIIILWSKGAVYKAEQQMSCTLKNEPGNYTSHMFFQALHLIDSKIIKNQWCAKNYNNIINVLWDKSIKADVFKHKPELHFYVLPRSWRSLLYHLHFIRSPNLQCLTSCSVFGSCFNRDLSTYPQGKVFLEAHKIFQKEGNYYEVDEFVSNDVTCDAKNKEDVGNLSFDGNNPGIHDSSGYYSMNNETSPIPETMRAYGNGLTKSLDNGSCKSCDNEEHALIHNQEDDSSLASSSDEDDASIREILGLAQPQENVSTADCSPKHNDMKNTFTCHPPEVAFNPIQQSSSFPHPAMFGYPSVGASISPSGIDFNPNHFGIVHSHLHTP